MRLFRWCIPGRADGSASHYPAEIKWPSGHHVPVHLSQKGRLAVTRTGAFSGMLLYTCQSLTRSLKWCEEMLDILNALSLARIPMHITNIRKSEEGMVRSMGNSRTRQTPDVSTRLWFPRPRLVCKITNTGAVLRSGCMPRLERVLNAPDIHIFMQAIRKSFIMPTSGHSICIVAV